MKQTKLTFGKTRSQFLLLTPITGFNLNFNHFYRLLLTLNRIVSLLGDTIERTEYKFQTVARLIENTMLATSDTNVKVVEEDIRR